MKCREAVVLENVIRSARQKILESAAELEGREFDRQRCRLQVAAFQLGKMAARLRKARKDTAGPKVRLELHDRMAADIGRLIGDLDQANDEFAAWPVRMWRRSQRYLFKLGRRHGRALRFWLRKWRS